jgi:hypothetical protein
VEVMGKDSRLYGCGSIVFRQGKAYCLLVDHFWEKTDDGPVLFLAGCFRRSIFILAAFHHYD